MNPSLLRRVVAATVLSVGLLMGLAGPAHASYPPGTPGNFDLPATPMDCIYNANGDFVSTDGFVIGYEITVPEATLTVRRDDDVVVHTETLPMGPGYYFYRPTGLEVFMNFTATLEADGQTVSTTTPGCPVTNVAGTGGDTDKPGEVDAPQSAATNTKPVTGSASWLVATFAGALLAAGLAMVATTRRRSSVR